MSTFAKLMSTRQQTMKEQVEELTGEEVIAVGQLKQGRTPSMAAMVTGTALIEVLRPRRSKSLPKGFALAVTPDRVVAFSAIGIANDDYGETYHVVVRDGERGTWSREAVSFEGIPGKTDGTLHLGGEKVPVSRPGGETDGETEALIALLSA